jgi:hypothetical protein
MALPARLCMKLTNKMRNVSLSPATRLHLHLCLCLHLSRQGGTCTSCGTLVTGGTNASAGPLRDAHSRSTIAHRGSLEHTSAMGLLEHRPNLRALAEFRPDSIFSEESSWRVGARGDCLCLITCTSLYSTPSNQVN